MSPQELNSPDRPAPQCAPPSSPITAQQVSVAPPKDRRANAIQHGFTAEKMLPAVLDSGRLEDLKLQLREEFRPKAVTEDLMIQEAARHLALLEVIEQGELAVLRQAAHAIQPLLGNGDSGQDEMQLTAALTSEGLERVARYRRNHEKGAFKALEWLRQRQEGGGSRDVYLAVVSTKRFATPEECEAHVQRRFSRPDWRCPRCKNAHGHWLSRRKLWECADCKGQVGLRWGTVFERSPLPLTTWFQAIRNFVANTSMTANELMECTDISRVATARAVLQRLRGALDHADVNIKLAGLTALPLQRKERGHA